MRYTTEMQNNLTSRIKRWAKQLKADISALNLAYRDKRTPVYAKILPVLVVGYALSPIDLIPDFIPVLGFLDDAIILPVLIWLTVRLIPPEVMADCRERAKSPGTDKKRKSYIVAAVIILIWLLVLSAVAMTIKKYSLER